MKTMEQIQEKIKEENKKFLSFFTSAVIDFLPFEQVEEYLNDEYLKKIESGEEKWEQKELTRENVIDAMREYMPFAWEKAENHKGISASRSISKFKAWLWLIDEYDAIEWDNYENYGCPILKQITDIYGFDMPSSDSLDRMSKGLKCVDQSDYDCGCGNG